jgi:hypothetical protein
MLEVLRSFGVARTCLSLLGLDPLVEIHASDLGRELLVHLPALTGYHKDHRAQGNRRSLVATEVISSRIHGDLGWVPQSVFLRNVILE